VSASTTIVSDLSTGEGGALVAVSGNATADGGCVLVLGQTAAYGDLPRDGLEVYRIRPGGAPERMAHLEAFDKTGVSSSGNLLVGDVDGSEPGDEIIVGEDGSRRPASRLRVFGGLEHGGIHLLLDFTAVQSRFAPRGRLSFALGHVSADSDPSRQEIVVGDRTGRVRIYRVNGGRAELLQQFSAFPDPPRASASKLAIGDLLPNSKGNEIVVADDGTRGDGLVRVFNGSTGRLLLEFEAFEPGGAPDGVETWTGDVIPALRGDELIVGQGAAGGRIRVFSLATGIPRHVLDFPDPFQRTTSFRRHLAVGSFVPNMRVDVVAVAQSDPRFPLEIFDLSERGGHLVSSLGLPAAGGAIDAIAAGR
jgi:hypothetical protein